MKKHVTLCAVLGMALLLGAAPAGAARAAEPAQTLPIYLIAGQSNAAGNTDFDADALAAEDQRFVDGFENILYYGSTDWAVNAEYSAAGPTPTVCGLGIGSGKIGPELGMAAWLAENGPEERYGLIKYAAGSTTIYDTMANMCGTFGNWFSPTLQGTFGKLAEDRTGLCYRSFLEVVEKGLAAYRDAGYEPLISGLSGCRERPTAAPRSRRSWWTPFSPPSCGT